MHKYDEKQSTPDKTKPEKASVLQVAKAVFFSFIGIRKQGDLERDAARITPLQAIIGGLIGAAIFVLCILLVVRFVTG
ncbi:MULTISPECIES: DUF2970 domain-containing protein [Nitrosomonas]|uniref:DUF2970 domain-containing protein n=1 Tax=Nitrosomonas halophila TaxID=44576 RepID=A0A1H3IJC4_9PROT|nr:DUF2970 domain-containing protein [Nitrosomonas halophila]SDY27772.1 Protein of unknown function [Nitrosomonas halophila]